ncbi:MAG: hypothetical protein Kow0027_18350 [Saprospiraceae bacterium]
MKTHLKKLILFALIALFSAFTFVPPAHHIPEQNRFVPAAQFELPPVDTLSLSLTSLTASPGETICLPVTASGFEKILSMQYTMVWDPAVLRLNGIDKFGLRGLGENNFGTHMAGEGKLTFSWYDPNLRGESRKDGSVIYELCFEVVGPNDTSTGVHFANQPTIIEISNALGKFLVLNATDGYVKVEGKG